MITAYASLDVAVSATKRGAFDFLAKPFTPEELRDAVRKAARHHILRWQARKLAQEKRQVRFQFLSVLVHELKAPLVAVEGYLRLLQEGADPETAARAVDRSLVRLDGMRKLIVDLLDLTRIESGQKAREFSAVDVVEVARAAIETALPAAQERTIAVELHAPDPVVMQADRGEIEIMLNNLVSNAVKYNRDGGRVDVTVSDGPAGVTMVVKDTGIGMTKEETAKLFGEFVRIKNAKTRNILGSGLGLSILRKLATLYGGDVTVASQPDVGTTFTVHLPAAAPANGVA
jgi:signal transduction histidine kinase